MKKVKKKKSESKRRRDSISPRTSSDSSQLPSSETPPLCPEPISSQRCLEPIPQQQQQQQQRPQREPDSVPVPQQPEPQALPAPEPRLSPECPVPSSKSETKAVLPSSKSEDLQGNTAFPMTSGLRVLGTVAVALGALEAAYFIAESL